MCRIIFYFFGFYYAETRRKLWPKAPAKEGALGHPHIHINFFKKPNKKIYNRSKELYCDATIFIFGFFIVYWPKKNGNWKMAQGCWLSPTHINYFLINFCSTLFLLSTHLGKSTSLINLMKFTQTNIFLLINEKKSFK